MSWRISVANIAKKQLNKIHWQDTEKIEAAIEALSVDPFKGDIQKLTDKENNWRRRVGSYRIFYKVDFALHVVYILEVKRRTSNTY